MGEDSSMAKYFGHIGFSETQESETSPGIWEEVVTERPYYGDELKLTKRWQTTQQVNDNVDINHELSIVSDPFALNAIDRIKYVTWRGGKWKVNSIRVEFPRLILSIGGVYNDGE